MDGGEGGMNEPERFVIPGLPITTNHSYGVATTKKGKAYMYPDKKLTAWQDAVMWQVKAQRVRPFQEWRDKWVKFTMEQHMPDPLSQDADGGLKIRAMRWQRRSTSTTSTSWTRERPRCGCLMALSRRSLL